MAARGILQSPTRNAIWLRAGYDQAHEERTVAFILWPLIGVVVAALLGVGTRRSALRPNANASLLAGAFGALIGGIIGDGVPHALAGEVTLPSIVGAVVGALLFCWAVRERTSDTDG